MEEEAIARADARAFQRTMPSKMDIDTSGSGSVSGLVEHK